MYGMYTGQDYFGVVKQYEEAQKLKEKEKYDKLEKEFESKKIYIAPGVYKFIPTPNWAKRSIISFK